MAAQITADPVAAVGEWQGGFRDGLSTLLADELIDAVIDTGRLLDFYVAFVEAASGASDRADAYTIVIGHREDDKLIVDVVRGVTGTYDPYAVTRDFAELLKQYGLRSPLHIDLEALLFGAGTMIGEIKALLDEGIDDVYPQEITRALLNLITNGFYAATKRKEQDNSDGYEPILVAFASQSRRTVSSWCLSQPAIHKPHHGAALKCTRFSKGVCWAGAVFARTYGNSFECPAYQQPGVHRVQPDLLCESRLIVKQPPYCFSSLGPRSAAPHRA